MYSPDPLLTFYTTSIHAIIRAEKNGIVPKRFTGEGQKRWLQFSNELTSADLLELVIQDAAVAYPVPFGLINSLPDNHELSRLDKESADSIIHELLSNNESQEDYIHIQADRLGIQLPNSEKLDILPIPESHHRVLELPGSGGWFSYQLLRQPASKVYLLENFCIACGTWKEVMLAGLIAFELNTPPHKSLPIVHDTSLQNVLPQGEHYDWIVGLKNLHANKALDAFVHIPDRVVLI